MREAQLRGLLAVFGTMALVNACGKSSTSSAQNAPAPNQVVPAEAPSNAGLSSQQPAAVAASSADNNAANTTGMNAGSNGMAASSSGANGSSSGSASGNSASSSGSPSNSSSAASASLTDAQIAGITQAANSGEIEQAKVARSRAKHSKVKQFADMMITHHQAAEQQQSKLGIPTADSAAETQLDQDASDILNRLKSASSTDFDREYIDSQVREHQQLLSMIDNQLLPNVKSTALKNYIEQIRSKVEMHLQHAQNEQQALESTSSNDTRGTHGGGAKQSSAR